MKKLKQISVTVVILFSTILFVNCEKENENFQDENQFNLESYQEVSNKIQKDLKGIYSNLNSKKSLNDIESVLSAAGNYYNNNNDFNSFEKVYKLKTSDLQKKTTETELTENENKFLTKVDNVIFNSYSEEEAIDNLTQLSNEVSSLSNFSLQEKNFAMGTIILSIEFIRGLKNINQTTQSKYQARGGFWSCMRMTAGKKIARGMVGGALWGLRGGIKGMAAGAVGGALFGAFWAAADCA